MQDEILTGYAKMQLIAVIIDKYGIDNWEIEYKRIIENL